MTTQKATTTKTARATYDERRRMIDVQLDQIRELLDAHKGQMMGRPQDWGYAGSLGHVNDLLQRVRFALGDATAEQA